MRGLSEAIRFNDQIAEHEFVTKSVDLVAVENTVTVGVGVKRIETKGDLQPVGQAVVIRVGIPRIGAVDLNLFAIAQAVVVHIRIVGIEPRGDLDRVRQPIAVGGRCAAACPPSR